MVYNTVSFKRKSNGKEVNRKRALWNSDWMRDEILKDSINFFQKSDLIRHAKSAKHLDSVKAAKQSGNFKTVEVHGPSLQKRTQKAEMLTSLFIAEHNVSDKLVDYLIPFVKRLTIDPEATLNMKMKEDKSSLIIKNVLYTSAFNELNKILNSVNYSVLVDESTDVSNQKLLCISVQYFHEKQGKLVQHLCQIINVDGKKVSGADLYLEFKNFFVNNELNMQNIIALASDNANVMIGRVKGFFTFLKEDVPHCILINCICHLSALVAKSCACYISKETEDLLRMVSSYFSHSPKRFSELGECLKFLSLPEQKI